GRGRPWRHGGAGQSGRSTVLASAAMATDSCVEEIGMSEAQRVEEQVSQIGGDRCCVVCGYNLVGRPVVREPLYRLLIVRCPECGTVSPMQEYPSLGPWARRWAAVLAGGWFVAMLGLWALGTVVLVGLIGVCSTEGTSVARNEVSDAATKWLTSRSPDNTKQGWWQASSEDAIAWWVTQGGWEGFAAAHNGTIGLVNWGGFAVAALSTTLVGSVVGAVWSVSALNLRRRRLLLLLPVMLLWTIAFALLSVLDQSGLLGIQAYGYWALWKPIEEHLGTPLMFAGLGFAAVGGAIGLLVGRSVVRGLLRLLLPWPARAVFGVLWTADGLSPPRPTILR
ncbi:MAG: hypothetical protein KDA22_14265, partial [Phycisphaerales bacterium]|nr:hypothetical protein [Phycisphaerales bacterium]